MREHLGGLIAQLLADAGYASGRRSFPRSVSRQDAADIAGIIHDEVDRGVAARQEAAAQEATKIACGRGCNYCCEEMVLAYEPEALAIVRWLRRAENEAARARFLEAYPRWREAVGDAAERLPALVAAGDAPGYKEAHVAQYRRRVLCAFNVDGDCAIYPVRPTNCRNAHAADTAERCRVDAGLPPPTRLAFVPLDEFLVKARQLDRATHHAIGGKRGRPEALCVAVHRLLLAT